MHFVDKKNKNSRRAVLQLIESKRVNGEPRSRIVVSLGSDLKIPLSIRAEVAKVITNKLKGQELLFIPPEVERVADIVIHRIQKHGKLIDLNEINKEEDIQKAYIDQISHSVARIAGPLIVGDAAWKGLGLSEILSDSGFSQQDIRTAEISILNRLISQDSENAIPSWTKVYATADLIDDKAESFGNDRFYRISDKLFSKKRKIEDRLYQNAKTFFNLSNTLILYDLTNTYFEGQADLNPKAKFSKNQKEKRSDCPQIVIALIIDGDGFVIRHQIFAGKMSDANSLKEILSTIQADYADVEDKPTIIFDRGITSEENIKLLRSPNFQFKYIIASRNSTENSNLSEFKNADFEALKSDNQNKVEVYQKTEGDEHYLLCKSSGRKAKEEAMRNSREEKLISSLENIKKRVFSSKQIIPAIINQDIGRLRQKYASVAQYYEISFTPSEFNYTFKNESPKVSKRVIDILTKRMSKFENQKISYKNLQSDIDKFREKYPADFEQIEVTLKAPELIYKTLEEKLEDKKSLEGGYLLRTNRDDLDNKTFWNTYTMLTRIEHAFRHLKSDLGLRPNQHHREDRVESHVFISILAYQLLQAIEYTLRQQNCFLSWTSIKRILSSHTYSTILIPTYEGKTIHLRKPGEPELLHKTIYDYLKIDYRNLPIHKMKI